VAAVSRARVAVSLVCCLTLLVAPVGAAKNKSGVAPQVLTLPTGGGTVRGLGETFAPDLNSGTGSYRVPLAVPEGRNGNTPSLVLAYSSGRGSGSFGLGWDIGVSQIRRRTEKGVPTYDDTEEFFTYDGMELVAVAPGEYRPRIEGTYQKIRHRKQGGEDFWEVWTQNGGRLVFGNEPDSRVENDGRRFAWLLTKTVDRNGNEIRYFYGGDTGPNRYLEKIEYAIYAVELKYEKRPDAYTDYRSGFGVETTLRCSEILMRLDIASEGRFDRIRRYALSYAQSPGSQFSLLTRVVQFGTDDTASLPALELRYSEFNPEGSHRQMKVDAGAPPASLADPDSELADVNADGLADVLHTGPTSHLYWLNLGDDSWAPAQQVRRTPQGVQLSDEGVLLADMDADGKSDLFASRGSSLGYWRSYGNRDWEEYVRFQRLPDFSFKDPTVRLMDINGDGLTDVLQTTNRFFTYWLNLDGRTWASPVSRRYAAIFADQAEPGTFFSGSPESDARLADMNGDGLQDLVSVHNGLIRYWPHRGYLRFAPMVRMSGTPRLPLRRFQRNRFLTGDINGDGFADLLYVDISGVYYWFNLQGRAWSEMQELNSAPYARGDTDVRLADLSGNGTRDLVWSTPVRRTDRTNYRYFDFVGADRYPNLLTEIDNNMGLVTRIQYKPVIADYLTARRKGEPWVQKLPIAVKVVASVTLSDNISHNEVETRYTYADGYFDGRDRRFAGFARADERAVGDTSSPGSLVRNHFYVGYGEKVSRRDAALARSLQGQLKRREIYGLDGSPLETKPYRIVAHLWASQVLEELKRPDPEGRTRYEYVVFPYLRGTLTSDYERTESPRHAAIGYEYDLQYGTVRKTTEYGEVQSWALGEPSPVDTSADDMRITTANYAARDDASGYVVRPSRILVTDKDGDVLSETENYYDGAAFEGLPLGTIEKGDLHRVRERAYTPEILSRAYSGVDYSAFRDIVLDEWIDTARYEYGQFGLLKSFKDARGNTVVRVEYDAYDLLPVKVTNALDHVETVSHNYVAGAISRHTDMNLASTTYTFDELGLVERIVRPGDSESYPTARFKYVFQNPQNSSGGTSVQSPAFLIGWRRERVPDSAAQALGGADDIAGSFLEPHTHANVKYFDGFGRVVQERSEGSEGNVLVSGWTEYNAKGSPKKVRLPFFSQGFGYLPEEGKMKSGGSPGFRQIFYDPLERLTRSDNADGSQNQMQYHPWRTSLYDEEDVKANEKHTDTPQYSVFDAFGQLVEMTEYAARGGPPITTRYRYDLQGGLVELTDTTGREENKRTWVYDLLGRKLSSSEPNSGTRIYFYDRNANPIYRQDNKQQWIRFEYDAVNRMTHKRYLSAGVEQEVLTNTFDTGSGSNLKGRLAHRADASGSVEFSYDARGRPTKKVRRLKGLARDFVTEYGYDSMDRVTKLIYPDTKRSVVTYEYDEGTRLEEIPSFVDDIEYNANGQRLHIEYANGVSTDYGYDLNTFRLQSLKTTTGDQAASPLQDLVYEHDAAGNILKIFAQGTPASERAFEYDSLYRLTRAVSTEAQTYDLSYGYDDTGNLVLKSDLDPGPLRYDSDSRPHTLDGYGSTSYSYDANGNLSAMPERTLSWDHDDRLVGVQRSDGAAVAYVYSSDFMRTSKRMEGNGRARSVYYIDGLLELRDGQEVYFVLDDQTQIASVQADGVKSFLHADHLGSTAVVTSDTGEVFERNTYGPYGSLLTQPGANSRFTGKELDGETGFYYFGHRYYDSRTGRWISADPLTIEAVEQRSGSSRFLNLYGYVAGNPLGLMDFMGLEEKSIERRVWESARDHALATQAGVVIERLEVSAFRNALGLSIAGVEKGIASEVARLALKPKALGGLGLGLGLGFIADHFEKQKRYEWAAFTHSTTVAISFAGAAKATVLAGAGGVGAGLVATAGVGLGTYSAVTALDRRFDMSGKLVEATDVRLQIKRAAAKRRVRRRERLTSSVWQTRSKIARQSAETRRSHKMQEEAASDWDVMFKLPGKSGSRLPD